jgi:hypothetical protein
VVTINNSIPDSMELFSMAMVVKSEIISSSVSIWVFLGVSTNVMEWLMEVSIIMNQESESKGPSLILGTNVLHNCLVSVGAIDIATIEPGLETCHNTSDVLIVVGDMQIRGLAIIANERLVIEVPRGLPATTSSLVVVGECDTLNEGVHILVKLGEFVTVKTEEGLSLVEGCRVGLLELVIGHSSDEEMGLAGPSVYLGDYSQETQLCDSNKFHFN